MNDLLQKKQFSSIIKDKTYNEFVENLIMLKTKGNNLDLYNRLIKIYEISSLHFAQRYLIGFLEDKGLRSVNEYINIRIK